MGINPSSLIYRPAHDYTPGLAALVWVGRLMFLEYSLPLHPYSTLECAWPDRSFYSCQVERLQTIRKKYLVRGCYSVLSEIIELKAVAKSIVKQEGIPANLSWATDGRSFTIGNNKEIKLTDFSTMHHNAISKVQDMVREMTLDWRPAVDLSVIQDDWTCRKPGWSFLEKPENELSGLFKTMTRLAWSSSFRSELFAKAGHWLPAGLFWNPSDNELRWRLKRSHMLLLRVRGT
ncbi:hypothetical protein HIM_11663 [Hirsutella minnesotensis 3608]|uniref:Uncharacterized protein n=1 Tax=Hirsutella minnesotensis 3608 TaxID=1043627 RepID=A0A0F7ZWG8_9HYPO|nr:hypothetical protein HIM_11663 [Hirsutella minnesotensis 3608]